MAQHITGARGPHRDEFLSALPGDASLVGGQAGMPGYDRGGHVLTLPRWGSIGKKVCLSVLIPEYAVP